MSHGSFSWTFLDTVAPYINPPELLSHQLKRGMEIMIKSGQISDIKTGNELRKRWSAGLPSLPGTLEIFKAKVAERPGHSFGSFWPS